MGHTKIKARHRLLMERVKVLEDAVDVMLKTIEKLSGVKGVFQENALKVPPISDKPGEVIKMDSPLDPPTDKPEYNSPSIKEEKDAKDTKGKEDNVSNEKAVRKGKSRTGVSRKRKQGNDKGSSSEEK